LRRGSAVGSFIRGVCGIWVDGDNPAGTQAAYRIKGEQDWGNGSADACGRDRPKFKPTLPAALRFVRWSDVRWGYEMRAVARSNRASVSERAGFAPSSEKMSRARSSAWAASEGRWRASRHRPSPSRA
jgi:hypothetical protein